MNIIDITQLNPYNYYKINKQSEIKSFNIDDVICACACHKDHPPMIANEDTNWVFEIIQPVFI